METFLPYILNKAEREKLESKIESLGPYAVALFPAPDLSVHVVIVEPDDGAIPVPAGSCPSSHKEQPPIDIGLNSNVYGRAVIAAFDILTVSVCLKDA